MTKLAKRDESALVKQRRRSLARVGASSGFFGSLLSMGVLAMILFVAGSLHVPLWAGGLFCIVVSTLGGWFFGKQGGRFIKADKDIS